MLLAALLQAQGARADGIDARAILTKLSDLSTLTREEADLLHLAVAIEAPDLLTVAELAAVLDPQTLLDLGLPPEFVADLLDDGPEQALQRLKEAFGTKLKAALASAERKAFGDDAQLIKAAAQAGGGAEAPAAAAGAAAGAAEAGLSPLALLAGVAGLGAIGVAVGGGGGGSSGNTPANVNDAPTTTNDSVAATEDTPVTFDVRTNDRDADGDPLTVTAINGTAITATTPVVLANVGTVALNANGTLTFTPLPNFNGAPSFAYTVSDGRGGTATGTATVTVAAVNDAPVNSVPAATLAASANTGVSVAGISVADVDSSSLTTTLSVGAGQGTLAAAAVAGGATITGSGTASVTLAGTVAQVNASLAAVSFTSAANFAGTATLTVSTSDGVATDVDTRSILVARMQTGVVSDGYIAGGTVFIDVNGNGRLDPGEPQTTTTATGTYAFASNEVGPIVAFGGTNIDTGLPNTVTLTAPVGSTVINPLTTIVQSLVATGVPAAQATMQVAVALGLPATTSLGSYDILAQPATDPVAIAAQKVATQIVTLLNTAKEAAGSSNAAAVETAVVTKLASAVTAAVTSTGESTGGGTASGSLNLTSTATLTSVLSNVEGISATALTTAVTKTASINQTIQAATDLGAITTSVLATTGPNVNLAPAGENDVFEIDEDGSYVLDLLANDADPEGGRLTIIAINDVQLTPGIAIDIRELGRFVIDPDDRELHFTPLENLNGDVAFTYTVADAAGGTSTGSVTLDIKPVNDAPEAVDDVFVAERIGALTIDPLRNDFDVERDNLAIVEIDNQAIEPGGTIEVSDGRVQLNADGTLTFTPTARGEYEVSFAYRISDGLSSSTADIALLVFGRPNAPPVAISDSVVFADRGVDFDLLGNDSDPDGDVLTLLSASVIGGTLDVSLFTLTETGISVALASDTPGSLEVSYTVSDGFDLTVGRATLIFQPANVAPTVVADSITTNEDQAITFDPRSNDSDSNGNALSIIAIDDTEITTASPVTLAGVGTIALNADGTLTFTPLANFSGAPSFSYTLSDGAGGTSTGTVTLTVTTVNDVPVAAADTVAATEDVSVTFDVRSNDSDADGDPLTVTAINGTPITTGAPVTIAGVGTIALNTNGTLTFTPLADFSGSPSFTYTASDGRGGTAVGTVTLNVGEANDTPVAGSDVIAAVEDTPITFDVLANDSDDEDDLAVVAINGTPISVGAPVTLAGAGTIALNPNGTLTFTPLADFNGSPTFTYTASDGRGGTAEGSVTLNVAAVADSLTVAADDFPTVVIDDVDDLAESGINRIDIDGPGAIGAITLTDGEATKLIDAGISLAEEDSVTLVIATSLSNNLQSLQALGVDSVDIVGLTSVSLDSGSLSALVPATLPQFDVDQTDGAVDVTLDVPGTSGGGAPGSLFAGVADTAGLIAGLGGAGIDHFDVGGSGTVAATQISGAQAQQLVAAGIDFADDDSVTVVATQLSTTLQSLQTLGIDSVDVVDGVGAIALDAGSLSALSPAGLPQFDVAQSDGALDVTLNVAGTTGGGAPAALFAGVTDPAGLIAGLGNAGIDHLDLNGSGTVAATQISGAQAQQLVAAGIDFADADNVTVAATQLSTSLQSLQTLGVDSVAIVGGATVLAIDAGSVAALSATGLPQFDVAQTDGALDLTLNVAGGGDLFAGVADSPALIAALGGAGIDHLDIGGDGALGSTRITDAEAGALVAAGIDFDDADTITVVTAGTQLATSLGDLQALGIDSVDAGDGVSTLTVEAGDGGLAALIAGGDLPQFDVAQTDGALDVTLVVDASDPASLDAADFLALAGDLAAAGVDHLDLGGVGFAGSFELSDAEAAALVATGLDFAANDVLSVVAAGTHLSTDLGDLQRLGVDSVDADGATVLTVGLGAGGLDGLAALPQFDVAQTDGALDVTLEIDTPALAGNADLGTLLGVDLLAGLTTPDLYGDLIDALIAAGIDRIDITGNGRVELSDGLADVLIAIEGFTAEDAELVLNAAGSGDLLRTSLHEMAHLGVDLVEVDDQGADPVYVRFGDGPLDETTLLTMLDSLDSDGNDATPLFTGSNEVALVVDQTTAEAIAQASGALDKLAELGFTEITILDGVDNSFIGMLESGPLEVKLIGQEDDLYDHLNP